MGDGHDGAAIRATQVLWALAGQLDVPGGRCFTMKDTIFPVNREGHIPNPDVRKALGSDRFPVYSSYRGESHAIALPESVLNGKPYQIRSLIILGGSMITAWPQPEVWRKTLNSKGTGLHWGRLRQPSGIIDSLIGNETWV